MRISDNLSGTQTATVPQSLTSDRSASGLAAAAQASLGVNIAASQIDPAAMALMNAKVNGSYFIPNPTITDPVAAKTLGYNVVVTGSYSVTRSGNSITKVTVRTPSASIGLIQDTLGSPRIMQISAHLRF